MKGTTRTLATLLVISYFTEDVRVKICITIISSAIYLVPKWIEYAAIKFHENKTEEHDNGI